MTHDSFGLELLCLDTLSSPNFSKVLILPYWTGVENARHALIIKYVLGSFKSCWELLIIMDSLKYHQPFHRFITDLIL